MPNPGAGQSRRYGTDRPHVLGTGSRMGDAGGTRGAGTRGRGENNGGNNNRDRERNNHERERNNDRERDGKY